MDITWGPKDKDRDKHVSSDEYWQTQASAGSRGGREVTADFASEKRFYKLGPASAVNSGCTVDRTGTPLLRARVCGWACRVPPDGRCVR